MEKYGIINIFVKKLDNFKKNVYNKIMEKINEQNLQELGIFEIRNIAREVGVYSPTTLKKQDLIEKIMQVINGEVEPYVKKTKQGRPPKNITTINDFIDVIVPKKTFEQRFDNAKNYYNVFNDNQTNLNVDEVGKNEFCFKGLVKVYNKEYALCFLSCIDDTKKDIVFINNIQTSFYKLKTGDEISGKYIFVDEEKPYILKEIYSVNENVVTEDFTRKEDYLNLIAISPNQKLKTNIYKDDDEIFADIDLFCPIAKGQRILLKSKGNNQLNNTILHRLSTDENNLKGLSILIDESPESYYDFLANSNFKVLSNNYNSCTNFDLEFDVRLSNLLRKVEEGYDMALYINSLTKLEKYFENHSILKKHSVDESSVIAWNNIKDIILLGKYTTNAGSLTVIVGEDFKENNLIESLFNNIICYNYSKYEYTLLTEDCKTLNIEKILTKSELNKLKAKLKN